MNCPSTHGATGYSYGDSLTIYRYKDESNYNIKSKLKCKICGFEGEAKPTGGRTHYYSFFENPIKFFFNIKKKYEPTWPDWLSKRYVYIDRPLAKKNK